MPSWPIVLYGSSATSVYTSKSGNVSFNNEIERWAKPFGLNASFPQAVFKLSGVFGKTTTWFTPAARASRTCLIMPFLKLRRSCPGIEPMGMFSSPSCTKIG